MKFEKLRVLEALEDDGEIARMDEEVMKELGLIDGDKVLVSNTKERIVKVKKCYPSDVEEKTIRLDENTRKELKVKSFDEVLVKKLTGGRI